MLAQIEGAALVARGVISEIERETLAVLRDRLRSGDIKFWNTAKAWSNDDWSKDGLAFDMSRWRYCAECGTVGCIGGLCYTISKGRAFSELPEHSFSSFPAYGVREPLRGLFVPTHMMERTPAEAAHAITTFLATGRAEWVP